MIEQTLTVVSVKGTTATLKPQAKKACEGCNGKCGSQIFAKLFGNKEALFDFDFQQQLEPGQQVLFGLDDSHVVKSSFLTYLLPLLFAIATAIFAAEVLFLPEGWQIILAFSAGFAGYLCAKFYLKAVKHHIEVIKIYPISSSPTQIDGD